MAPFDQREQHVINQFNFDGNINIGSLENHNRLTDGLEFLRSEILNAAQYHLIDNEICVQANSEVSEAIQLAKKNEPDKVSIIDYLSNVKSLLEGVTAASGLVKTVNQIIQLVQNFL